MLHPFGRYSNAFKFAGEVDVLEALDHVRKHYRIDDDRVVMRGFSMGGAGCWQMAAHYPGRWAAAAPGAGFSETEQFLKVFQKEKLSPTWYEKKLWQMYDCPVYAGNFFNLPLVAYSGEKDSQKQAADVMAEAYKAEGLELVHLIGPNTGHGYHPTAKAELNRRIDILAEEGPAARPPARSVRDADAAIRPLVLGEDRRTEPTLEAGKYRRGPRRHLEANRREDRKRFRVHAVVRPRRLPFRLRRSAHPPDR